MIIYSNFSVFFHSSSQLIRYNVSLIQRFVLWSLKVSFLKLLVIFESIFLIPFIWANNAFLVTGILEPPRRKRFRNYFIIPNIPKKGIPCWQLFDLKSLHMSRFVHYFLWFVNFNLLYVFIKDLSTIKTVKNWPILNNFLHFSFSFTLKSFVF